jgi:hypothetical protein
MPARLTKTGITFNEVRFWSQDEMEEGLPVTHWYVSADYYVETAEGETWRKSLSEEVSGPTKTKAADLLASIRTVIMNKEDL